MIEYGILFLITLLAFFIKGITGFGNTLVINSLFTFLKENRFTTPVDLLLGVPTDSYMVWRERRNLVSKIVIPLSIVVILGDIPGVFMLRIGGEHILKSMLGLVLIGIAVEMFTRKSEVDLERKSSFGIILIVGLISGVLMGIFGIGALLAAYINRTSATRSDYRANMCFVFVVDDLFRLIVYSLLGLINLEMVSFALLLFPAALLGLFLGFRADKKISDEIIKKSVIFLLAASGVTLIAINRFGILL